MNATDIATIGEVITVAVTLLGGGAIGVAKLTRIAVAVEGLVGRLDGLATSQQATAATVAQHEARLAKGGL